VLIDWFIVVVLPSQVLLYYQTPYWGYQIVQTQICSQPPLFLHFGAFSWPSVVCSSKEAYFLCAYVKKKNENLFLRSIEIIYHYQLLRQF